MAESAEKKRKLDATSLIALDDFCQKQFSKNAGASHTLIDYDPEAFIQKVNDYCDKKIKEDGVSLSDLLVDGYAPFCKHIFMPNFLPKLPPASVPITPENEPLIRSKYEARTDKELAVLVRYLPRAALETLPQAKFLDLILYSREQIKKENAAMNNISKDTEPWGLISIKPQMQDHETPMQPITMLRNALGADQGGSGVSLDRDKYKASVDFWSKNISIS
eukprot:gb/GEZN01015121.1/.p1 GENE.gb/GEZN01015121.1/~~gb/GEZN01015121.1/.p1  ORF type:complete len:252 (+),score=32.36 gb/GEZN01015121.1/:97-756(+)